MAVALILGVGYWAWDNENFTSKPADSGSVNVPKDQAPADPTPPPQTDPTPPKQEDPPAQPEDPNKAILEGRSRIDRSGGAAETMTLTVYYMDGLTNGERLQPVEMVIERTQSLIRVAAEQVINAPGDLRLYSGVPTGTVVQSVNLKDGVAIVDLSPEAATLQGSANLMALRASFVYTLTELPNVSSVQLLINGAPAAMHGSVWDRPISRSDYETGNSISVAPVITYVAR